MPKLRLTRVEPDLDAEVSEGRIRPWSSGASKTIRKLCEPTSDTAPLG